MTVYLPLPPIHLTAQALACNVEGAPFKELMMLSMKITIFIFSLEAWLQRATGISNARLVSEDDVWRALHFYFEKKNLSWDNTWNNPKCYAVEYDLDIATKGTLEISLAGEGEEYLAVGRALSNILD